MKILIHGFYGAGNAGDDAILHSIINTLKDIYKEVEVTVTTRSNNIPAYYDQENTNSILGSDIKGITSILKDCNLLIVGGGGLFQDYNSFSPENIFINQHGALNYYSYPIILAKMLNVKTMLYAVGVGPLSQLESKQTMRWISEIVDTITVRDTYSYELLRKLGVTKHVLAADPAIKLPSKLSTVAKKLTKNSPNELNIGLNMRNWSYAEEELIKIQDKLLNYLNSLANKYSINYYIMPFNKLPSEVRKAKELAEMLNGNVEVITYDNSPERYKYVCGKLDIMIAMRLHASIFAIYEGVPSIGISYDGKVSQFYKELQLDEYCFEFNNPNYDMLFEKIEDCIKRPTFHNNIQQHKRKGLMEREENNKKCLLEVCELNSNDK
ncbi:polysaccharide pyruvyl transferase family protein [Sutcliffiella cohnii]